MSRDTYLLFSYTFRQDGYHLQARPDCANISVLGGEKAFVTLIDASTFLNDALALAAAVGNLSWQTAFLLV
jgi:hypothetical protein